jgi:hypothetical protein
MKEHDSRKHTMKLYLDGLTKEVDPKAWMLPAMIVHLKGAFKLEEDEAESFCEDWLAKYHNTAKVANKKEIILDDINFNDPKLHSDIVRRIREKGEVVVGTRLMESVRVVLLAFAEVI